MGRNVGRLGNGLGCVPDRIYRGVSDWEDGVMDYYTWVDPFVEIERANHRAAYAREDGRNDVLNYEYRNPGLLQREIENQAYKLAEKVVQEQIRPTFYDAMTQKRVRDASLELLSFTPLRHVVSATEDRLSSSPIYDVNENHFGVVTEVTMKPFRYAVRSRLS